MNQLTATGSWSEIRKLRKGTTPKQGRLKNDAGDLVESDGRADTLAKYLESVQWAVRPLAEAPPWEAIFGHLPVNLGPIAETVVVKAAAGMKREKAAGLDNIPAEIWKACAVPGSHVVRWLVQFCNTCWQATDVPDVWHRARVAMLHKKGDPADCAN